eukprot:COSAG02_NODE_5722_length_4095_cov_5.657908_3_plen_148_part_00
MTGESNTYVNPLPRVGLQRRPCLLVITTSNSIVSERQNGLALRRPVTPPVQRCGFAALTKSDRWQRVYSSGLPHYLRRLSSKIPKRMCAGGTESTCVTRDPRRAWQLLRRGCLPPPSDQAPAHNERQSLVLWIDVTKVSAFCNGLPT